MPSAVSSLARFLAVGGDTQPLIGSPIRRSLRIPGYRGDSVAGANPAGCILIVVRCASFGTSTRRGEDQKNHFSGAGKKVNDAN
jgi:hypothetical protein